MHSDIAGSSNWSLTCLLRSSVILWIWIFFLPMFPVLRRREGAKGRGGGVARSEVTGWLSLCFFLLKMSLWVRPPACRWLCWKQGGCRLVNLKKKKKIGRRRRGRAGFGVRRPLQIMVLFSWGQVIHTQAELGSSALPFTSAGQLLKKKTTQKHSDWARRGREALFVYRDPL